MTVSATADVEHDRDVLTQALTLESRNALARVELAAGELGKYSASPRVDQLTETIHEAVEEMDRLLGTIGRLHAPPRVWALEATDVQAVTQRVVKRLSPAIHARGIELRVGCDWRRDHRTVPARVLDRILIGMLRLAMSLVAREGKLSLVGKVTNRGIEIAVSTGMSASSRRSMDPKLRTELAAQAAEWGGAFSVDEEEGRLNIVLPAEADDV